MAEAPLSVTPEGLYCPAGNFHIDPWRPVERAVVTHAHSDHARSGCASYLVSEEGLHVSRVRLGAAANIQAVRWGEPVTLGDARVSLHPAGHILGSAQIRIETPGGTAVVTGDFKTEADSTCTPWEPLPCDLLVMESTFGLPVYRWQPQEQVFAELNAWWRQNSSEGRTTILLGYALGKAQRLLAGLDPSIGPILTHGAVEPLVAAYRESGVRLPPTTPVSETARGHRHAGALVLAPPSAVGTAAWLKRFAEPATGFASGWMRLRGTRRRGAYERGFVLSDHADWPGLLDAVACCNPTRVWVTHGYTEALARWLRESGREAEALVTRFVGDAGDEAQEAPPEAPAP